MLTTIVSNRRLNETQFLLRLKTGERIANLIPGQFFMCRIPGSSGLILRRPFSISDANSQSLEIAYKVTGAGTSVISQLKEKNTIDILGPFGNGFLLEQQMKNAFLVAGGIGVAPFPLLAKVINKKWGKKTGITLFYGARSSHELVLKDKLSSVTDKILFATEDGSKGKKGFVTDLLSEKLGKLSQTARDETMIFASGPTAMLKAVDIIAQKWNVRCQISVETVMGCGYGVCLGCVMKVKENCNETNGKKYKLACKDGPVFYSGQLEWD